MKFLLILLVLLGCFAYIAEPFAAYKANSVRNKHHQLSSTQNDLFWTDGLKFGCTGCGRCCQNEGEVYLDTDEFSEIASHLKLSQEDFLSIYAEKVR